MEKRLWDLGVGRLPFYRLAPLRRSCDIMAKTLMGTSSAQAKPVPVHTKTKRQHEKKLVFLFPLTQGLQTDLLEDKRWAPREPRTPSSSRKVLLSRSMTGCSWSGHPGGLLGCHFAGLYLHDDQLASTLTLDEFSSSSSSSKKLELLLLLSLLAQQSFRPPAAR